MSKLYKSSEEKEQRNQYKIQAVIDRLGWYDPKFPKCDYCQSSRGTQYHERVARSKTVNALEARILSYVPELCNLLCPTCHERADEAQVAQILWQFNVKLYGMERVLKAFENLNDAMRVHLSMEFLNVSNEE